MKKNAGNRMLKILAGLVALALIGLMLFVTNSFIGNPISAMAANRVIKQYVDRNYAYMDLEVDKATYNLKYGGYMARAKSKTSIDTKFAIYYRDGEVERDDYESYVLGKFNTLERLSEEYSAVAKYILAKNLGYENNTTLVMYDKEAYEKVDEKIELDMKFDKTLPIQSQVTIRIDLEDTSLKGIAQILTDAHKVFLDNDCHFNKYGLFSDKDEEGLLIMVTGVTPSDIESGELLIRLENAQNNESMHGITVFIKGEQK